MASDPDIGRCWDAMLIVIAYHIAIPSNSLGGKEAKKMQDRKKEAAAGHGPWALIFRQIDKRGLKIDRVSAVLARPVFSSGTQEAGRDNR